MVDMFWQQEFASWGRRFGAWILDFVIFLVAFSVVLFIVALAVGGELSGEGAEVLVPIVAFSLLWEVAWISGASGKPGQRLCGFRIRQMDGAKLPVGRAVVRWAVRSANYVFGGLEAVASAITIAATPRKQSVHDLVASSVAVVPSAVARWEAGMASMAGAQTPHAGVPASPFSEGPVDRDDDSGPQRGPFL